MIDLRERRRLDTEREIAAASIDLFERKGVAATTVDEIAEAAGVSPRTFFRYFATKEESVLRIHRDFDDEVARWLDQDVSPVDLLGQLESVHEAVIGRFANGETDVGRLLLRTRGLILREPALQDAAHRLDVRLAEDLVARLAQKLPDGDPVRHRLVVETAGTTVRLAIDEWARLRQGEQRDADLATVYERTRALLRGVTQPDGREPPRAHR